MAPTPTMTTEGGPGKLREAAAAQADDPLEKPFPPDPLDAELAPLPG